MKYNVNKMIEAGTAAMKRHPQRDVSLHNFHEMSEAAAGDRYLFAENAFLFGVEVGRRIANAERKAAAK